MSNPNNTFNNPYLGNLILGGDKVYRHTPDCIVSINGSTELHTCQNCKTSVNLQEYITSVTVDAGVAPTNGSASINLAIPRDFANCIFRGNNPLISLGMEINVYMRGYFPVNNLFKEVSPQIPTDPNPNSNFSYPYYPVFHGIIRDMSINYSDGFYSVMLSVASILYFWTHQKMSTSGAWIDPAGNNAALGTKGTFMNNNFMGKSPYGIIYELFHSTFGAADGSGFAISLTTNVYERSSVDGRYMFQHAAAYWAKRFTEGVTNLRMFGANGSLFNGLQQAFVAQGVGERQRISDSLKTATDPFSKQLRNMLLSTLGEDTQFIAQNGQDVKISNMVPYVMDIASLAEAVLFESQSESKMDIVNKVLGATGYEFFQDVDGDMVFKPPFYNMNVKGNKIYTLEDSDIISLDLSFKEPAATYITTKGSHINNINVAAINGEYGVRSDFYDWKLIAKFGFIPTTFDTANINDSRTMYFSSINKLALLNKDMEAATVTIPLRPEMRVGYPVYIPHIDSFYYVDDFSHSFSYGGRCTTSLRLSAKRSRFFPPSNKDGTDIDLSNRLSAPLTLRDSTGQYVGIPNVVLAYEGTEDLRLALKRLFALDSKKFAAALAAEKVASGGGGKGGKSLTWKDFPQHTGASGNQRGRFEYSNGEFVLDEDIERAKKSIRVPPIARQIYDRLTKPSWIKYDDGSPLPGVPPAIALAIMGNMYAESGFDAQAYNSSSGATGLVQWIDAGGRQELLNFARTYAPYYADIYQIPGYNPDTGEIEGREGELWYPMTPILDSNNNPIPDAYAPYWEVQVDYLLTRIKSPVAYSLISAVEKTQAALTQEPTNGAAAVVHWGNLAERGAYWEMDESYARRIGAAAALAETFGVTGLEFKGPNGAYPGFPPTNLKAAAPRSLAKDIELVQKASKSRSSSTAAAGSQQSTIETAKKDIGLDPSQKYDRNIILSLMLYLKARGMVEVSEHNSETYIFRQRVGPSAQNTYMQLDLGKGKNLKQQEESLNYFIDLAKEDLFGDSNPTAYSILGDIESLSDAKVNFKLADQPGEFRYFSSSMPKTDDQGLVSIPGDLNTVKSFSFNSSNKSATLSNTPNFKPTKGFNVLLATSKSKNSNKIISSDQIKRISFMALTNTKHDLQSAVEKIGTNGADPVTVFREIHNYICQCVEEVSRSLFSNYYEVEKPTDIFPKIKNFKAAKFKDEIGFIFEKINFIALENSKSQKFKSSELKSRVKKILDNFDTTNPDSPILSEHSFSDSLNSFIYECLRYFIEGYFKVDLEKPGQASTEEERKNISYTIEKFLTDESIKKLLKTLFPDASKPIVVLNNGVVIYNKCSKDSKIEPPGPKNLKYYKITELKDTTVEVKPKRYVSILPVSDDEGYTVFGNFAYGRGIHILNYPLIKNLEETDFLTLFESSGKVSKEGTKKTGVVELLNNIAKAGGDATKIKQILNTNMEAGAIKDSLFPYFEDSRDAAAYFENQGVVPSINSAIPLLSLKPKLKSGLPCVCNLPAGFTEEVYGEYIKITPDKNIEWLGKSNKSSHYSKAEGNLVARQSLLVSPEDSNNKAKSPVWFSYPSNTEGVSPFLTGIGGLGNSLEEGLQTMVENSPLKSFIENDVKRDIKNITEDYNNYLAHKKEADKEE
jgi:hypothetical protein